ncbi:MAG TPA: circularly permuted type 2 ATP-grasp protein [Mycobacteriales bacterium]|nr:circularly permuted type 2 ATP-grasp protein [Mycobacteriales bacterium]
MSERAAGSDVVESYAAPSLGAPSAWDEMVDPAHGVRETWRDVGSVLRLLGPAGLADEQRKVAALLAQDGVTYRRYGAQHEEPWALDPVPLLIEESEWKRLEPALVQRSELLDLILSDLYGARRLLIEGIIPPEIVLGHEGFIRSADQIRLPGARQLFMSAADLVRGPDGGWQVLADRTQAPSGTGYAMANRRVVSRALPGLYRDSRIHRIGPFFQAMRLALQSLAPTRSEVPRIVLLTSGTGSETAFDQAFLSSLLGFPLVEGSDLEVREGQVWQRSIGRFEPVDVILRRVDAWFCDPLELRPNSQLGVPGLLEASRLGTVSVVNGIGTGVLENPALFPFLPRLCEVLLDQSLALPSVQTWWCGDEASRRHVLANLGRLVVKPVAREIVRNSRFGWELSAAQREELSRRIAANPSGWVGQEAVQPSTTPAVGDSGLVPRAIGLRTFAVTDASTYRVLPGGLSRTASRVGSVVVSAQTGAEAKDVWVLSSSAITASDFSAGQGSAGQVISAISPRVAESLFWLGRYAERAEDISRLVAVTDNRWNDVHPQADPAVPQCAEVLLRGLLDITATRPEDPSADPRALLVSVIGDGDREGSLAHDLRRVRDLSNASRDQLSTDTWGVFSDVEAVLAPFAESTGAAEFAGPDGGGVDVATAMTEVRAALLAFAGLAAESMVRDAGWHFMDAGRRIERAAQVARLLSACLVRSRSAGVDRLVEESVLIAAESIITHRRRYPVQSGAQTVLELLLNDRDNPRSVAFQLDRLDADLRRIAPASATKDLDAQVLAISAQLRTVDCATLATADETGRRDALGEALDRLVADLHSLAGTLEQTHFAHLGTVQQLVPITDLESLEAV